MLRLLVFAAVVRPQVGLLRQVVRPGVVKAPPLEGVSAGDVVEEVDAVVVGCGPAGLASAMELRSLGYERVVALERRCAAEEFEQQKAYLYLVDARGQRWTDRFPGLTESILADGVSNEAYSITRVYPDERGAVRG